MPPFNDTEQGTETPTTKRSATTGPSVSLRGVPFAEVADLRDYFAAKAMTGILADVHPFKIDPDANAKLASMGYAIADAMLAERSK